MIAPRPELRLPAGGSPPPRAGRAFFTRDTVVVARELLGALFVRRWRGRLHCARIVETEAYLGPGDPACHTARGRTPRTAPMWEGGGRLYVYLVYGMHHCANVVTRETGAGEAVLIRAAELPGDPAARLLSGPGKFAAGFALTRAHSGLDLVGHDAFSLHPDPLPARRIARAPRVGVDYAGAAARWKLRFFLKDSPAVSRR